MGIGTLRRYREAGIRHTGAASEDTVTDFDGLTVKELRAYAAERGVDLKGATKKAELVDLISRAASTPTEQVEGQPADGEQVTDENAGVVSTADGVEQVGEIADGDTESETPAE